MSLKLRTRNHQSLQGCFSAMPLIPVPIWGLNVLKTVEIAIWRKGRTTWMELERVFCHWNYFHFSSKNILWPSYGGRSPPWLRHWLGFQSEPVVYMLTTSGCQVDFASWTFMWLIMENALSHTYVLPINEQKQSAKSCSFGYFSS